MGANLACLQLQNGAPFGLRWSAFADHDTGRKRTKPVMVREGGPSRADMNTDSAASLGATGMPS